MISYIASFKEIPFDYMPMSDDLNPPKVTAYLCAGHRGYVYDVDNCHVAQFSSVGDANLAIADYCAHFFPKIAIDDVIRMKSFNIEQAPMSTMRGEK